MWINTIRSLSIPTTSQEFPQAMKTKAYSWKNVNTQLASWASLKHDALLYVKPPRAVFCGCDYPKGYVEPKITFWESLISMVKNTAQMLEKLTFPNKIYQIESRWEKSTNTLSNLQKKIIDFLQRFADITKVFLEVSKKELKKELLTFEESDFLRRAVEDQVGGSGIGSYSGWYYELFYPERYDGVKADIIVADVHTNYGDLTTGDPGAVLHLGLGETDTMIMVVENVGSVELTQKTEPKKKESTFFWRTST